MRRGEAVNWIINLSADIGKAEHSELWHYEQALSEIREMLESEPERKKGKWIGGDGNLWREFFKCSVCMVAEVVPTVMGVPQFRYCPNCGAEMEGENDAEVH